MLKEQAELLIKLKSFQIDLSFKRVKGDINEFEINTYDEKHKLGKFCNYKLLLIIYYFHYILISFFSFKLL